MLPKKASIAQIRERFDADVERFSNLETGQTSTVDAALALDLVASAAARVTPNATRLLDVGCGAGNYTLRLLQELPGLHVTLVDLSEPMLERARERVAQAGAADVTTLQADINELHLPTEAFDVVLASAVLHHLRDNAAWEAVFAKLCGSLAPGGSLWVFDLVESSLPEVQALMWERYGEYLAAFKGTEYRDHVFDYIASEDTPRPLLYQLDLLRANGLQVEVLHVNTCFAAFGGVKR
jgi:tRNA (cmo5U34)-methyltransferase